MDGAGLGAGTLCLLAPGDVTSQPLSVPDVRGASGLGLSSLSVLDSPCDRPWCSGAGRTKETWAAGLGAAESSGCRGERRHVAKEQSWGADSCHSPVNWFSCMAIFPSFSSASFSSPPSLPSWTLSLDPTNQAS